MTEPEVLAKAEQAAVEAGRILPDFDPPQARCTNGRWRVFYQMKHPAPVGGHFSVYVEESGATRLAPGR